MLRCNTDMTANGHNADRTIVAVLGAPVRGRNAASKRVMWQGIGHGASIYSTCAVPPLIGYLNSGKLPGTDTYCPA